MPSSAHYSYPLARRIKSISLCILARRRADKLALFIAVLVIIKDHTSVFLQPHLLFLAYRHTQPWQIVLCITNPWMALWWEDYECFEDLKIAKSAIQLPNPTLSLCIYFEF